MEAAMAKISAVIWIMLGTVLAGIAVLVVVVVPALADQGASLIPLACGIAFLVAIPLSYLVAREIAG